MDIGLGSVALAIGAGVASVLSPCVLPVVPIVAAGADRTDRMRPLMVVTGLALSFMAMGAISSLFGELLIGRTRLIEQAGGAIILVMGLMVLFDISVFKRLYMLSNIPVKAEGRFGGVVLGMALGVIWVPCIGPMLSSILTMVGTSGELATGVILLGFYSIGFAIPMLIVAYSSQMLQEKLKHLAQRPALIRYATGVILSAFGLYALLVGNLAFN